MYPRFGDLDYDQDYDLIMGHGYADSLANYIIYWQNVGTMYNASFIVCDTIVVYPPTTITSPRPALTDIEADGDLDLLVGETGGALLFYRNLDNPYQAKITITIYGNDIMLSWESIPGAEEYYIYYQSVPYFIPVGIPQAIVVPPNTNWTDVNALNQGKRYYQVVVEY
jgi:hypothetical protein